MLRASPDDYDGLASLVVAALRAPLPVHQARTEKPCSRCGRVLRLDAFNVERRTRDGQRADCRECQRVAARAAYTLGGSSSSSSSMPLASMIAVSAYGSQRSSCTPVG